MRKNGPKVGVRVSSAPPWCLSRFVTLHARAVSLMSLDSSAYYLLFLSLLVSTRALSLLFLFFFLFLSRRLSSLSSRSLVRFSRLLLLSVPVLSSASRSSLFSLSSSSSSSSSPLFSLSVLEALFSNHEQARTRNPYTLQYIERQI